MIRIPSAGSVERHWVIGLAIVLIAHGVGHAARDLGLADAASVLGFLLACTGLFGWFAVVQLSLPRTRRWLRPIDRSREPIRTRVDTLPADIDRFAIWFLICAITGIGLALGAAVPGVLPPAIEIICGVALAGIGWVWSVRSS